MFRTISMKQLEKMLDARACGQSLEKDSSDAFLLLDVRDAGSYRISHLQGAVNLPYEELVYLADYGDRPKEFLQDRPIVVYCSYGSHSLMAARILDRLGYDVINTCGGLAHYRGRYLV